MLTICNVLKIYSTSDSIQDFQNMQSEMKAEFSNARTGKAVKDSASEVMITSKSLPSHKPILVGVDQKEKRQKKSNELSSSVGPPLSSVVHHAKAVPGSDQAKVHTLMTQNSTGYKKVTFQPSVLEKSKPTMRSLSSITIPMRLDALAYLLNHAVLNPYNMMPQVPCFTNQCNIATYGNVNTCPNSHIPLTCCPCQRRTPCVGECSSTPTFVSQQHNSTNVIYPNHMGYQLDPVHSVQNQNNHYTYQAVGNKGTALNSDNRWEKARCSPSSTTTTKWEDTPRPNQTFDETSYSERHNSSFNQARGSSTRNYFRSTPVQGSSGNWRSCQTEDQEDCNLDRSTDKFTDDLGTNYRGGGTGDCYRGSGFGRKRSFGSDFRNRKSKEENPWFSDQKLISDPKQVCQRNAESSRYQRAGPSGSMSQGEVDYMGEKSRHKLTESTVEGKTSIFTRKQMIPVEDWDAEYDTKQSKSSFHEEKSPALQETKYQQNRPTHEDWETDYSEGKATKQENPSQPELSEEKMISNGKESNGEVDNSSSLVCVQSTTSEVSNIFNIMEKDAAIVGKFGVTAHTTELGP